MQLFGKKKRQRGFTVAELLVVVAILAILLAFGVPILIQGFRSLHLTELDDSARSIFLAAQNRMTAMVANSEFDDFAKDGAVYVAQPLPYGGSVTAPSDFPQDAAGSGPDTTHGRPSDLYYLDSADPDQLAFLESLVGDGAIESELHDHRYVIEYNVRTGAIYAVWYTNAPNDKFNYADLHAEPRARADRLKQDTLVGYYGGSGVDRAKVGQMPIPEVSLTNAEELRLTVKIPATSIPTGNIKVDVNVTGVTGDGSKKTVPIITGAVLGGAGASNSTGTVMLDTLKTYTPAELADNANWDVAPFGKQFKDWVGAEKTTADGAGFATTTGLIPGEDITVTVRVYYAGTPGPDGKLYLPQEVSVSGNSLFASVVEKDVTDPTDLTGATPAVVVADAPTALIAYGRHLQNLRDYNSSNIVHSAENVGICAAEQIRELDFDAKATGSEDSIYFWASTYHTAGDLPAGFTAIHHRISYNGNGLPIRNLTNKNSGAIKRGSNVGGGLFSNTAAASAGANAGRVVVLQNIVLIDTALEDVGSYYTAGVLAAGLEDAHIANCQVYLEENTKRYTTDHITPAPQVTVIAGSSHAVGGLVGGFRGDNIIQDSFASTVIQSDSPSAPVGGLVGTLDSSASLTIRRSYAAGYLEGGSTVGGLVGNGNTSLLIENSYAAGVIANAGSTSAGGLVGDGQARANGIENSYAAVLYGEAIKEKTAFTVYGAAANVTTDTTNINANHVFFVRQPGVSYQTNSGKALSTKKLSALPNDADPTDPTKDFLPGTWYRLPAELDENNNGEPELANPSYATFPYNHIEETSELETPYPYPQLKAYDPAAAIDQPMLHYGDWLEAPAEEFTLCYYERTTDAPDKYGLYAQNIEADRTATTVQEIVDNPDLALTRRTDPDDTVQSNRIYAVTDGYALFTTTKPDDPANVKVDITLPSVGVAPYNTNKDYPGTKLLGGENIAPVSGSDEEGLWLYFLPNDVWQELVKRATANTKYYTTLRINGEDYLVNPLLACEALNPADGVGSAVLTALQNTNTPTNKNDLGNEPGSTTKSIDGSQARIIRTARQLKALGTLTQTAAAYRGGKYNQLLDIDYDSYAAENNGSGSIAGLGFTFSGTDHASIALTGTGTFFDGHSYVIRGLHVTKGYEYRVSSNNYGGFGLFGCVENATLQNIRLVNTTVAAQAIDDVREVHAGTLAGGVNGGTVTNCGAYVEAVGGQSIDDAYNTFTVSTRMTTKNNCLGGLIGWVCGNNVKVSNSFAAVKVWGTYTAGGFVGGVNSTTTTFTDCYVGGHTKDGQYTYSEDDGANVTVNKIITGKQTANVGGFVGLLMQKEKIKFTGTCYTTASVAVQLPANDMNSAGIGQFSGSDNAPIVSGATLYALGKVYTTVVGGGTVTPRNETFLQRADQVAASTLDDAHTFNYDDKWDGKPYPYATGLTAHHGDWVELPEANLAYFEGYTQANLDALKARTDDHVAQAAATAIAALPTATLNGDTCYISFYGSWTGLDDTARSIDTLVYGAAAVPNYDGYAALWEVDGDTVDYHPENIAWQTAGSGATGTVTSMHPGTYALQDTTSAKHDYYIYLLDTDALQKAAAPADAGYTAYYRTVDLMLNFDASGPRAYKCVRWFNPHFAAEARNTQPANTADMAKPQDKVITAGNKLAAAGTANAQVIVRTARHLANMQRYALLSFKADKDDTYTDNPVTWHYDQLANIEAGTDTATAGTDRYQTTAGSTVSVGVIPFLGETDGNKNKDTVAAHLVDGYGCYDGHDYAIRHLSISRTVADAWDETTSANRLYTGLFGQVIGGTLRNINLDTVTVHVEHGAVGNNDELLTGALAGRVGGRSLVSNVHIVDADVRATLTDNGTSKGMVAVGGMLGRLNGNGSTKLENSGVRASSGGKYDTTAVAVQSSSSSTNGNTFALYAGGLIGDLTEGAAVDSCYAAVRVTGDGGASNVTKNRLYVGGFAGRINKTKDKNLVQITSCYAGGRTVDGTYTATANVTASGGSGATTFAGGFAGHLESEDEKDNVSAPTEAVVTFSGTNYSTCSVENQKTPANVGEFIANDKSDNIVKSSTTKLYAAGALVGASAGETGLDTWLGDRQKVAADRKDAVPYDVAILPNTYPYETDQTTHYGDWIEPRFQLAYFEAYDDANLTAMKGAVGGKPDQEDALVKLKAGGTGADTTPYNFAFYGIGKDSSNSTSTLNTLPGGYGFTASADGYALLWEAGTGLTPDENLAWSIDGVAQAAELARATDADDNDDTITIAGKSYYVYILPTKVLDEKDPETVENTSMSDWSPVDRTVTVTGMEGEYTFNPYLAPTAHAADAGDKLIQNSDDVVIRTARQLNNLTRYQACPDKDLADDGLEKVKDAKNLTYKRSFYQQLDIDFDTYATTSATYGITLTNQSVGNIYEGTYDGDGVDTNGDAAQNAHTIRNMVTNYGLFFSAGALDEEVEIRNLRLVNMQARGGALASWASYATIRNVGVYLDEDALKNDPLVVNVSTFNGSGTDYVIKAEDESDDNIYPENYQYDYDAANGVAGGLVGTATSCDFYSSFAAVRVFGYHGAGGLVAVWQAGDDTSATHVISNCYASGRTTNGTYDAYTGSGQQAGNVTAGAGPGGGLIGQIDDSEKLTFEGVCYTTVAVSGDEAAGAFAAKVSGEAPYANSLKTAPDAKLYALGPVYREADNIRNETEVITDPNMVFVEDPADCVAAHPYDATLVGTPNTTYPYLSAGGQEHYGDWPKLEYAKPLLAYYEAYNTAGTTGKTVKADNNYYYGFHAYKTSSDTTAALDTLDLALDGGNQIVSDGYAILLPQDLNPNVPSVKYLAEQQKLEDEDDSRTELGIESDKPTTDLRNFYALPLESGGSKLTVSIDGVAYYVYPMSPYVLDHMPRPYTLDGKTLTSPNYYTTVTVGTTELWLNPHFPYEALNTKPANVAEPKIKDVNSSVNYTVALRTPRHLHNLTVYNRYITDTSYKTSSNKNDVPAAATWTINQQADLDYAQYHYLHLRAGEDDFVVGTDKAHPQGSIGMLLVSDDGSSYRAGYTTNSHAIKNLFIKGQGLIAYGRNISLSSFELVNVAVEGFDPYAETESQSRLFVGGLVGLLENTTSFSAAQTKNCGIYVSDASNYTKYTITNTPGFSISSLQTATGGLTGKIIAREYSSELDGNFAAVKVTGANNVGGLIGWAEGNNELTGPNYSAGYTVNGQYEADTVNVSGYSNVGGFIGFVTCEDEGLTKRIFSFSSINNTNYTTCSVKGTLNVGYFIGAKGMDAWEEEGTAAACYALGKDFSTSTSARMIPDNVQRNPAQVTGSTVAAEPYDKDTLGMVYPYPHSGWGSNILGRVHYGDWPTTVGGDPGMPEGPEIFVDPTPEPSATPVPAATPEPTPTPAATPVPTATPTPTPAPDTGAGGGTPATPEPAPTPTPAPAETPAPTVPVQPGLPSGPEIFDDPTPPPSSAPLPDDPVIDDPVVDDPVVDDPVVDAPVTDPPAVG